ncbi:lipopolysaccharide biosynthesis protein [Bacteroides sp. 519]|uniref:lipopolysaccharide biosynthesis protein n=1 Tax=Bacteroides sp. 519 TaxID=2302937 RepID=UPI0013D661FF|nr:hypothetical protein [Bacteroides sp. 519]NDV60232.1 hypothetical protein [Bacteroides sp. 519]
MRTDNSRKNLIASVSVMVVMTLLGFITRKVFIDNIGVEYLGLNGLLLNILNVVSLLEGGFGTSIVYNLYKPLAIKDKPRVIALIQLYRKIYRFIALGVLLMGLAIYPFLDIFIKEGESLKYVSVVFFIFLFNSIVPYFAAYKWSLINADQKQYKLAGINLTYQVGASLVKLAILLYTGNYILYLLVESLFVVGYNLAVSYKANQLYAYIKTRTKYEVDKPTRKKIVANTKALFLHSLGGYLMHSTDNIVISSFVSITIVGLYSNYTLITGYINTLITQVLNSLSESVGHLIATESSEYVNKVFNTIFLLNFIIVSLPVIVLSNTLNPFIAWWLGTAYLLDTLTIVVILINLYIFGMRISAHIFKVKSGIFLQDKFSPLLQGCLNLILSLVLVQFWGITGVLLATTLSVLSIGFWQFPYLVYKYTFKKSLRFYFVRYAKYSLCAFIVWAITFYLCNLIQGNSLIIIVYKGTLSLVISIGLYYVLLGKTSEMQRLLFAYVKPMLLKTLKR